MPSAAILDVDGTLVDTNYQHAIAWFQAFRQSDCHLPIWRIHRHIGMGGDQLVEALAGTEFDSEHGDEVRAAEKARYLATMPTVEPLGESRELIEDLKEQGRQVVLASSAKSTEIEHYLDLLDARDLADHWTHSSDVEETKPEPDLVVAALDKLGTKDAVMVGDTPWDVEAARRAGIETVCILTGGFSRAELEDAGAVAVFESVAELRQRIGDTPLG